MPRTLARSWIWCVVALFPALTACGAKTTLWSPPDNEPRRDAGSFDGSVADAGADGGGGVVVECGRSEQFTTPRREITLSAMASSDAPIVAQGWSLVRWPDGATAQNAPVEGPITALTPDVLGEYLMRFAARDALDRSATCEVRVHAIVGPPVALCPEEELVTGQSMPLLINGDGFDDERIVSATWRQLSGPEMARLTVVGGMGAIVEFVASRPGTYRLALEVTDPDGESDECEVDVRVSAPPVVDCSPGAIMAPTRQPVTVRASATDERTIASTTWELISQPSGSASRISPTTGLSTTITPDRQGEYQLRFTATDDDGLSASCIFTVFGTPTPPTPMCPPLVETAPLTPTSITASAVDDGTIRSWAWSIDMVPPGSRPGPLAPPNAATTVFTPDLAGEYTLRLRVTDNDGQTGECTTLVRAVSGDGLRVEMFWDTNGTDMDTHLLRPGARAWFDPQDDCFYSNCRTGRLMWGTGGAEDDPRLDIDDVDGFGPENINIRRPQAGRYRVGVHAFGGTGRVTVRIYCADSTTTPRQTFGPVQIPSTRVWRVADVDVRAGGCTITDLASGGTPNIITRVQSERAP